MLNFVPSLISLLSYGSASAASKKAIGIIGRHKAIVYAYIVLVVLLAAGAVILGEEFSFPLEILPFYIAQVSIGALGAIAAYKALDYGKASIVSPIGKVYVLAVLATSIIILGEELTIGQIAGSVAIVGSAVVLAMDKAGKLKAEKWMLYLGFSVICRAYYFTFIKNFVLLFGAYQTAVLLEVGIAVFTIAFHALRGRDISPPAAGKLRYPAAPGILVFIGSVFYNLSVSYIGAALTAAISAGTPIVNSVASYALLREKLDMHKYAAIVLMVVGLAMVFLF